MKCNRRAYLAATAASAAAWAGAAAQPREKRPNILWIMTDQQPADLMSAVGNSDLVTPAMDELAARGVRFDLAYCPNPICVPSRASMMTGKMPNEVGVTHNMDLYKMSAPSLGSVMTDAGYDTGYIGKWHIPMPTETSNWHGFNHMREGSRDFNDQHFAEPSIEFIQKPRNKPFFLVASFVNPHDICEWARRATGGFPERRMVLWNGPINDTPAPKDCPSLPDNFEIPEHEPDIIREYQTWQPATYPTREWPAEKWRQYRWALCRLTERVDAEIAKILEVIDEDTVVIFTSDHGDGNGAHRWNQKTLFYEESARVPFILAGPNVAKPGAVDREHLVQIGTDIFATVVDYAGVPLPEGLNGHSLKPLAANQNPPWRDALVAENDLSPSYGFSAGVEGRMLRVKDFKYVVYNRGKIRERLTDMRSDPGEMINLAVDPAHASTLKRMREKLAEELAKTNDAFVVPGVEREGWTLDEA